MSERFIKTLSEGLSIMNLNPQGEVLRSFATYFNELKRWSAAYNITSLRDEREIALMLFLDSLLYLRAFRQKPGLKILDVGSGGGFPGLVIKVAIPMVEVTLLEPSRKRVAFLRHIIKKLELHGADVVQGSVEDFVKVPRLYDVITTKALFRLYDFIRKAAPLISDGGILVLSKGPNYGEELDEAERKLQEGIKDYSIDIIPLAIPTTGIERNIIVVKKQNPSDTPGR